MKTITGITVIFVSLLLLSVGYGADQKAAKPQDRTICSILQRGDTIFAVAWAGGIYRASVKEKVWRRMNTPPGLPKGGKIVEQNKTSPLLVYYRDFSNYDFEPAGAAVFVSEDGGSTWKQASPGKYRFMEVYIHPNGSLFAFERMFVPIERRSGGPPPEDVMTIAVGHSVQYYRPHTRLVVSRDLGKSWQVITENFPKDYEEVGGLFQDPGHPDQVCFMGGMCKEVYLGPSVPQVYYADDASYQWKLKPQDQSEKLQGDQSKDFASETFFTCHANGRQSLYSTDEWADFDTLWMYPMLQYYEGPLIASFRAETGKLAYTFSKDAPKVIPIKVVFGVDLPGLKFLDEEDETVFWGISVRQGGEFGTRVQPKVRALEADGAGHAKSRKEYLDDPNVRTITVDAKHPYLRNVDLAKLYDFSKPGSYEIQLLHDDEAIADWGGDFASGVIEVTITQ